ncbi:hypothetical protein [Nitrososphaera viennensis]|uniref:YtkA-like domain-containing protein n=2 Tax=Nitrososphaera viennensis TaxID=1034015 RepID=A0A060HR58_9ARCH|nr:hypothetical protein [Nitrososphaera viennensis]AIC15667.1 hypothetical protein NVIE_014270 [Nitrososphaera viennensis EN76]UVS70540.1 hypothetical protein NWT39_07080 [Nitrososphaera viennensis]
MLSLKSLACAVALAAIFLLVAQPAFADPLKNAVYKQRLGNYDFEVATEPARLVAGEPAKVVMRIAGVNGDDLVDVPVKIRLVKDGAEVAAVGPVIVPYGHYAYDRTFAEPGRYVLYADLTDNAYSGQTLTFIFELDVAGQNDYYLYTVAPGIGAAGAAVAGAIVIMRRNRKKAKEQA